MIRIFFLYSYTYRNCSNVISEENCSLLAIILVHKRDIDDDTTKGEIRKQCTVVGARNISKMNVNVCVYEITFYFLYDEGNNDEKYVYYIDNTNKITKYYMNDGVESKKNFGGRFTSHVRKNIPFFSLTVVILIITSYPPFKLILSFITLYAVAFVQFVLLIRYSSFSWFPIYP